jgi:hypothetical protein
VRRGGRARRAGGWRTSCERTSRGWLVSLARGVRGAQARVYAGAMADLVDRIERRGERVRLVVGELQRLQRAVGVMSLEVV